MRVLQILWATDLESGGIHTPATGMRFVRSRAHGGVGNFNFDLESESIRLEHGLGPNQATCIDRIRGA